MQHLETLRHWLVRLENWCAALSLLTILVLTTTQIIARNFFETGLPATDTITRYLVLYVTFFGAILAIERGRHIKIDALNSFISDSLSQFLFRPIQAFAAFVCYLLADAAVRFWQSEWLYAADYERWQVLIGLIIPTGFILLCLHFTLSVILGKNPDYLHDPVQ
jgi:TRAP-type C4-dicarboxylate transport system permease small subunit